ncbi:MAG TPA: SGNH/GDSL hydrolase family protein [Gemmatimonadaceae bacterium]|nr:SGNH/GDSL hydrolase family protein [Gemmatimonadaceae bacterium]
MLAALAVGEVVVRLLDLDPKMLPSLRVGTYDLSDNPILRYVYQPGYRPDQEAYDPHHQNFSINSDSFRDREFTRTKAPGTIRIVTLGDSITAGNGVPDVEKIYPRVLERKLRERLGERRYEVYNLAVGGYHTLQEAEMLRVRGLEFDPDIAIIGFCINDFSWIADGSIYARLKEQGHQRRGPAYWLQASAVWVLSRSRLAFVLFHRVAAAYAPDASDTPNDQDSSGESLFELGQAGNNPVSWALSY